MYSEETPSGSGDEGDKPLATQRVSGRVVRGQVYNNGDTFSVVN